MLERGSSSESSFVKTGMSLDEKFLIAKIIEKWLKLNGIVPLRGQDKEIGIDDKKNKSLHEVLFLMGVLFEREGDEEWDYEEQVFQYLGLSELALERKQAICDQMAAVVFRLLAQSGVEDSVTIMGCKGYAHTFVVVGLEGLMERIQSGESSIHEDPRYSNALAIDMWSPTKTFYPFGQYIEMLSGMADLGVIEREKGVASEDLNSLEIMFHVDNLEAVRETSKHTYYMRRICDDYWRERIPKHFGGDTRNPSDIIGFDLPKAIAAQELQWNSFRTFFERERLVADSSASMSTLTLFKRAHPYEKRESKSPTLDAVVAPGVINLEEDPEREIKVGVGKEAKEGKEEPEIETEGKEEKREQKIEVSEGGKEEEVEIEASEGGKEEEPEIEGKEEKRKQEKRKQVIKEDEDQVEGVEGGQSLKKKLKVSSSHTPASFYSYSPSPKSGASRPPRRPRNT